MFEFIKNLITPSDNVNFGELYRKGASIVDVRTPGEFNSGHIKGSKNIPLQNLNKQLHKINTKKPVIVCCASGSRSGSAKRILESNGVSEVYNGGGWQYLQSMIQ